MIKPGDTLETAVWIGGTETDADLKRFFGEAMEALKDEARAAKVVLGPPRTVTKRPGDDRVPPVPDGISGPDARLLVVEADVVGRAKAPSWFTQELEPSDLEWLRRITRAAYAKAVPGRLPLSDAQCDTCINDLGPEAAEEALHRGRADISKTLH